MKKFISILLALVFIFSLVGCVKQPPEQPPAVTTQNTTNPDDEKSGGELENYEVTREQWEEAVSFSVSPTRAMQHLCFLEPETQEEYFVYCDVIEYDENKIRIYDMDESFVKSSEYRYYLKRGDLYTYHYKTNDGEWFYECSSKNIYLGKFERMKLPEKFVDYDSFTYDGSAGVYKSDKIEDVIVDGETYTYYNVELRFSNGKLQYYYFEAEEEEYICVKTIFGYDPVEITLPFNTSFFDESKIRIGATGPLTGDAAIYGNSINNSAKMAIEEINAIAMNDGELGIKLDFLMLDDKHNADNAQPLFSGLISGGMQVSLGTVTSSCGIAIKELTRNENLFFLTPSASSDEITEYSNGYQMCYCDSSEGTELAKYFNQNYLGKKIGVLFNADEIYPQMIAQSFKEELDSSFVLEEASVRSDTYDFGMQIDTLKDCDIIFLCVYEREATSFMLQANNISNSIKKYYGSTLFGFETITPDDISAIPQEIAFFSHFAPDMTQGAAKEFADAYEARYGMSANEFGASAYDCVWAIYEALKVAKAEGKNISANMSASELCEILKSVFSSGDFVFNGVTGAPETTDGRSNISWNSNGRVNKSLIKIVIKEGRN